MKIEMKTQLTYIECTRILQGLNTLENIWKDANTLREFDRFTIDYLRTIFSTCRDSINKNKKIEIRIIEK